MIRTSVKNERPRERIRRKYKHCVSPLRELSSRWVVAEPIGKGQGQFLQLGTGKGRTGRRVDVRLPGSRETTNITRRAGGEESCEKRDIEDGDIGDVGRIDSRGHDGEEEEKGENAMLTECRKCIRFR